jgi:chemotaxis regulatin CheY-phosphate phosphatase CheZ
MLVDCDIEADEADTAEDEGSMNNELSELMKYVEVIASKIRGMESPVTTTFDQLPQAGAHLSDLAKITEEGMDRVMALTEAIETNRGAIQAALEHLRKKLGGEHATDVESLVELVKADERRLVDIHVALSFQDLVAQRVATLVAILNEVKHKLLKLVVLFGIKQKKDGPSTKKTRDVSMRCFANWKLLKPRRLNKSWRMIFI